VVAQLATLTEQETVLEEESLPPDLLPELQRRLDQGLSDAERQEIVRLLVRRITVHTTVQADGKKTQRALIEYRLPGGGATCTGTAASLNYTLLRRVIELPTGRQKKGSGGR
jgi:hypothetical protein